MGLRRDRLWQNFDSSPAVQSQASGLRHAALVRHGHRAMGQALRSQLEWYLLP